MNWFRQKIEDEMNTENTEINKICAYDLFEIGGDFIVQKDVTNYKKVDSQLVKEVTVFYNYDNVDDNDNALALLPRIGDIKNGYTITNFGRINTNYDFPTYTVIGSREYHYTITGYQLAGER